MAYDRDLCRNGDHYDIADGDLQGAIHISALKDIEDTTANLEGYYAMQDWLYEYYYYYGGD